MLQSHGDHAEPHMKFMNQSIRHALRDLHFWETLNATLFCARRLCKIWSPQVDNWFPVKGFGFRQACKHPSRFQNDTT